MPLIQVKVIEGVSSPEQKREIIHRLTEARVSVEGEALRPETLVRMEEVRSGEWSVGGESITTEKALAMPVQAR